jgi:type 1 glutamine amidotransferase
MVSQDTGATMTHRKTSRSASITGMALATISLTAISMLGQQPAAATPRGDPPGYRPQSKVNGVQSTEPLFEDKYAVLDALPEKAPATPKQPRKLFVFAHATGYAHSNIPIAAFTMKALGDKTGAWTTTISYSLADFNSANLAQYDAMVLDNTTGTWLDDSDKEATAARHKALMEYIRGGKGLVLLHASGDSYHTRKQPENGPALTGPAAQNLPQVGLWPEYNKMVGGYFKFHWIYPQQVTVKIDDPKSPLTAMFHGKEFTVHDEIYTFAQDSFSRKNVHVLTSVDYAKMSDADKAIEPAATKRTDGDYALSWIRPEGKGRLFYEVIGHSEHVYFLTPILEQILAGTQYALGDLKADDSPSVK